MKKPHGNKGRPSPQRGKGKGLAWLKANVGYAGDDCLIWPFSRNEKGYGQTPYEGRMQKAHRVMCILAKGEPPEPRYHAAHSCHKGHEGCVNPKHLDWKTPSENTREAVEQNGGVIGGYRRLTIDQVEEIRRSDKTHAELSAEYGVHINTIGKICRREIWTKVRSTVTRAQILQIKDLSFAGTRVPDIARQVGVTQHVVRRLIDTQNFRGVE